jgi:hypothetical protein
MYSLHPILDDIVDSYFSMPISILNRNIPDDVIPSDAFERHVMPFLDARHVGLYGLATDDFTQMNNLFTETEKRNRKKQAVGGDDQVEMQEDFGEEIVFDYNENYYRRDVTKTFVEPSHEPDNQDDDNVDVVNNSIQLPVASAAVDFDTDDDDLY